MPKLKPGTVIPTHDETVAINAGIAADADARELGNEWQQDAKPASDFFPPQTYAALVAMKCATDAVTEYLPSEPSQLQDIQAGIHEADAGQFASDQQVKEIFGKYGA